MNYMKTNNPQAIINDFLPYHQAMEKASNALYSQKSLEAIKAYCTINGQNFCTVVIHIDNAISHSAAKHFKLRDEFIPPEFKTIYDVKRYLISADYLDYTKDNQKEGLLIH